MERKYRVLQNYFGYSSFRKGQEGVIDAILAGRDVLAVMPTGGGKSICYQVPAMLFPGVTFVISPLISLMKDQVMALKNAGIPAAFINSSLTPEQIGKVLSYMKSGRYRIIYVAPERLAASDFLTAAAELTVSLVAVDEAHCISEWGQDFRPSYLAISDFVSCLPTRPVVAAFTATATEKVRGDIIRALRLCTPYSVVTGFDRPNLRYDVEEPPKKMQRLLTLLHEREDKSGIIYCSTRKQVDKLCEELNANGFGTTKYHAGLAEEERKKNQEDFVYDRFPVMVATNAFGMGIDKSNVSFVIHYNMPKSIEAYYQEAGRAGRDGEPADCILLFSVGDVVTAKYLIRNSNERTDITEEERVLWEQEEMKRLRVMEDYCRTDGCYRHYILRYFGQESEDHCGNCGNCVDGVIRDVTVEAQKILSCLKRAEGCLGHGIDAVLLLRVLKGSNDKRLAESGLRALSTFGIMKDLERNRIRQLISQLTAKGYIRAEGAALFLTPKAAGVLFGGDKVEMRVKGSGEETTGKKQESREKKAPAERKAGGRGDALYEMLRKLRNDLAAKEGVPAYIIFSNAALADMAKKRPVTMQQFSGVSGVGEVKLKKYGEIFTAGIAEWIRSEKP